MPKKNLRHHVHKHVDKKLRRRLRLYFIISIILIGVVIYEMIANLVSWPLASAGIVIGLLVGFISARMFHISWDHDAQQIASRLDLFGGIILVLYIVFAIFRGQIIGHFVQHAEVGGVSISIATGIMIGRILGTRGRIIEVLKEQKVF